MSPDHPGAGGGASGGGRGAPGRGDLLGYEGVKQLACRAAASIPPLSPLKRLAEAIVEGTSAFAQGPLTDDVCLLLARRSPAKEPDTAE